MDEPDSGYPSSMDAEDKTPHPEQTKVKTEPASNCKRVPKRRKPGIMVNSTDLKIECKICGDISSGFHYGVHACEGCKGFFRRTVRLKLVYEECKQMCKVDVRSRNKCQYCRYQKCLNSGMSHDAIRFGRMPRVEKQRIIDDIVKSKIGNPDGNKTPVDHSKLRDLIENITKSFQTHISITRSKLLTKWEERQSQPSKASSLTCLADIAAVYPQLIEKVGSHGLERGEILPTPNADLSEVLRIPDKPLPNQTASPTCKPNHAPSPPQPSTSHIVPPQRESTSNLCQFQPPAHSPTTMEHEIGENFLNIKTMNEAGDVGFAPSPNRSSPGFMDFGFLPTRLLLQEMPLFDMESWRPRSSLESSPGSSSSSGYSDSSSSSESVNLEGTRTFTELYEKFNNVLKTNPDMLTEADREMSGSLGHCLTAEQKLKLMGASNALKRQMEQKKGKDNAGKHSAAVGNQIVHWLVNKFQMKLVQTICELTEFTKTIPHFSELSLSDQVLLLKFGSYEALFVMLSLCVIDKGIYLPASNLYATFDFIKKLGVGARLIETKLTFAEKIATLNLNDSDMALFLSSIILSADRPGLMESAKIESYQLDVLMALQLQLSLSHPDKPRLFAHLLVMLTEIRQLVADHVLLIDSVGELRKHYPPLIEEIIKDLH